MLIGITGQSGCGKTTVSKLLQEKGYFIVDCDEIAHFLMENDENMLKEIRNEFGNEFFDGNSLNRKRLGQLVFNSSEKLKILNSITHRYIIKRVKELIEGKEKAVIDAPLLIEAGLDKLCDKCIYVYCPREIRVKRIMKRDNITKEYALSRLKSQHNDDFYRKACDYTVVNDGISDVHEQLKELFD